MALLDNMAPQGQAPTKAPTQWQPPGAEVPQELINQAEELIIDGMKLIHHGKTRDRIIQTVGQAQDPVRGIANVLVTIIKRIEAEKQAPNDVKVAAASFLVGELATVTEAAGIAPLNQEQQMQALSEAIRLYTTQGIASGKMDPQQLQAEVWQMQQAGGANGPVG